MTNFKALLKSVFIYTNTLSLLDKLNYFFAKAKNKSANNEFIKQNKNFKLPTDYYLYETYKLDYKQYKEDGFIAAKEISEWTFKYLPKGKSILEWGCGVARIIRHFNKFIDSDSNLFACDINNEMIDWNIKNIDNVTFKTTNYNPPTDYNANSFDLIFALSVFTHIENAQQSNWIKEIARIIKPNGIFLFTTHGKNYINKLTQTELLDYKQNGSYTISYKQKGHRMMTTYNNYQEFKNMLEEYFEVLEFYDGQNHREKVGGQDLWIVRRNPAANIRFGIIGA